MLGDHGTYVGPGHWFEVDDRHFRLGFGWPTVSELRAGLDALTEAGANRGVTSGEQCVVVEETDAAVIRESQAQPARFGVLFDRHATVLFRYLVRRVGVDDADALLGEVFRIAFEKRATYDCERPDAAAVAVRHRDEPARAAPAQ